MLTVTLAFFNWPNIPLMHKILQLDSITNKLYNDPIRFSYLISMTDSKVEFLPPKAVLLLLTFSISKDQLTFPSVRPCPPGTFEKRESAS